MCNFFHPVVTMPPFPSSIIPQQQFPFTAPLPQRPFPPLQAPLHTAFLSYSSSSAHSVTQSAAGFEKPPVTDLVLQQPPFFGHKVKDAPLDEGFGSSRDDRRVSVTALTLAPLTCPKSTVHIVVEDDANVQKFPVHRDLLCFYSPYFQRILTKNKAVKAKIRQENHRREWRWEDEEIVDEIMEVGGSAASDERIDVDVVIKLPNVTRKGELEKTENADIDVAMTFSAIVRELKLDTEELGNVGRGVFAAFVDWLYHSYQGFGLYHPLDDDHHQTFDAATLIQLWVFAGRVGVPECQNHCIEGIEWWRMTSNVIQTSMLGWVYENTTEYDEENCGLRSLLVDQCAWKLDGNWLLSEMDGRKNEEQFPRHALVDLVSRMRVILNEHVPPPFVNSEMRKEAYWMKFGDKRFCEVL